MENAREASWNTGVWIDEVLGPDAYECASGQTKPVLLVKPAAVTGLTAEHVESVEQAWQP